MPEALRMLRRILFLSTILITGRIAGAEEDVQTKSPFTEALLANRQALELNAAGLSGSGATTLREAVRSARYILLGEDHFTREIPALAGALCDLVQPDAYAVEVGPFAARYVQGLLRLPSALRIQAMKEYLRKYPDSIAFLNSRAENDLAAHCVGLRKNPEVEFWGLDQEFLGSAGALLDAMVATSPGPQARDALAVAQSEEKADALRARASADYAQLFMLASTDEQIGALRKGIDADGNAQTQSLMYELTASRNIYRLHTSDRGASLAARAELLKQHFLADYRPLAAVQPNARILFKFGDNHMGKGLNATHDLDLGNFLAEHAAGENVPSVHILVLGLHGMHFTTPGYGKPMGQEAFDMSQVEDYQWLGALASQLFTHNPELPGQTLTLFDLRKLRYRDFDMPAEWERVVYSFDLLVVEPSFTVADEIR
jgi:hypothetical protein